MPSIIFNFTPGQLNRVKGAFGKYLRLGQDATEEEIRLYLIRHIASIVRSREFSEQEARIVVPPFGTVA